MNKNKEFMINDLLVEASRCTFEEYKVMYAFESDEWRDDCVGWNVIFHNTGASIFFDYNTFKTIAQPSEY